MLFDMEMAMINLGLMDFPYMGVLMGSQEKFCGYGFAAVIVTSSSQFIFLDCIRRKNLSRSSLNRLWHGKYKDG